MEFLNRYIFIQIPIENCQAETIGLYLHKINNVAEHFIKN
jgi:hypothetical protein